MSASVWTPGNALDVPKDFVSILDYPYNANTSSSNNSAALLAALESGDEVIFVPSGTYLCASIIEATLVTNKILYGPGVFKYFGANTTDNFVRITCNGFGIRLLLDLGFDGDNKTAGGLRIENTLALSNSSPEVELNRVLIQNMRMNSASIWNNGAYISGSFSKVTLIGNKVKNITRAAGTGTPGVSGTAGIYVSQYDSTKYIKECIHTENLYSNISGDDLVGSANNVDYDGFKFFTPNPTNFPNIDATNYSYSAGTCLSFRNVYENCRGRAVKIQALADVYSEKIIRNADYTIFGGSTEINLQYGAGKVKDIEFFYTDYAGPSSPIQTTGHVLIGFFQGAWYNETNGGIEVKGIRVYNNIKTGVGNNIAQIVNAQVGAGVLTRDKLFIKVADITVPRGDVDYILTLSGDAGADGLVVLENVSVNRLTYSAVGSQYTNPGFKLNAVNIYNLDGVNTPANAKKFVSDTAAPGGNIAWQGIICGYGNYGFLNTYNRGADFTYAPLLVNAALTGTGVGGAASVQTVSLADDAVHTFERRFYTSNRGLLLVSVNYDYNTQGLFACGSDDIYLLAASAGELFEPSITGTNPDIDGQFNMWFTGGSLNVKNRLGNTYQVTVMFIG